MFYRIVTIFGVFSGIGLFAFGIFAMMGAFEYLVGGLFLYLPAGVVNMIHWMFTGEGFYENNKVLTFIFLLLPHLIIIMTASLLILSI